MRAVRVTRWAPMSTPTIPNTGRVESSEGIATAVARAISTAVGGRFIAMDAAMIYPGITSYGLACSSFLLTSTIQDFTLPEGNRHLNSVIARRSRPCGLRFYHALAIRPRASVEVPPAVLNPEHKFGVALFHRVFVKSKSVRTVNDLAVGTSEQYVCCRFDHFNLIVAGGETVASEPELKWNGRVTNHPFLSCSLPHQGYKA